MLKPRLVPSSVLRTLAYADVFDYPLTAEEIWFFLIASRPIGLNEVRMALSELVNLETVTFKKNYYFLLGRGNLVDLRETRREEGQRKKQIAAFVGKKICLFPWIKAVYVTGALAMENSGGDDDIDVLIVCQKNRVWLVRFLVTIFLTILGKRRGRNDKKYTDKFCVNMLLSEGSLSLLPKERNLFTAHEILQAKIIAGRAETNNWLIQENPWIKDYLPNVIGSLYHDVAARRGNKQGKATDRIFSLIDFFLWKIQVWYMRRRKTIEVVERQRIMFHPLNRWPMVMLEYKKRLKKWPHFFMR